MNTITAAEAGSDIGELWKQAADGPVLVVSAGQAAAVVLSPGEFDKLTARRRGAKAGFAKHLFPGTDMNALLETGLGVETSLDDVFKERGIEILR